VHPDWKKGGHSDLALLYLKSPVRGVEPTRLYRESDEGGKGVVIVGSGYTGKIGEKPLPKERWDRKKRAAINTVDRVTPRILGLKIKPPRRLRTCRARRLRVTAAGPAFIETPEGILVAGIGYATDDANADGIIGNVGDWELYVRVSAFVTWIEATMLQVAKQEADALLGEKVSASGESPPATRSTRFSDLPLVDRIRLRVSAPLMRTLLKYLPKEPTILARLGTIELAFERFDEAERAAQIFSRRRRTAARSLVPARAGAGGAQPAAGSPAKLQPCDLS
jgi:hypothetical protein